MPKTKAAPYSASDKITFANIVSQYDPEHQLSAPSRSSGHREEVAIKWSKILSAFNGAVCRPESDLDQLKNLYQKMKTATR